MSRSPFLAVVAAGAFALAGCSAGDGDRGSAIPPAGAETVGDVAAIIAHQPTDSQNTAAAIEAISVLGSRINALADASADDAESGVGGCRNGREFLAAGAESHSTETREFLDPGCTQIARDVLRAFALRGPANEVVDRTISLYGPHQATPIAIRRETSITAHATFDRWGFPVVRDGYAQTTFGGLWIGNLKLSAGSSQTLMPSARNRTGTFCEDSTGYTAAGIPLLDAAFGWEGGTFGTQATRADDGHGLVTLSTIQRGSTFVGPRGSLSIAAAPANHRCPANAPAFRLAGGDLGGAFAIPIRAVYRHGVLWDLTVSGATLADGYRLNARSVRTALGGHAVTGVLANGGVRVASLAADAFGNGTLTITSSGAQYRLIDWTIVR